MGTSKQNINRNMLISIAVTIVLCCCGSWFASTGYDWYQVRMTPPKIIDPNVPQGGLAELSSRTAAWQTLQQDASLGCDVPIAEGTTIAVLQEKGADGAWVEEWNVNCRGSGAFKPYRVIYTPQNGIINVRVESP